MFSARNGSPSLIVLLISACLLLTTAGCHSKTAPTPENFIVGLNAHFLDHPECIFPTAPTFPYETSDLAEIKQMNTLVTNQLLTASSERSIHASRYTPTAAGVRVAPRFCYGHRVITSIDSFTPPATANGLRMPSSPALQAVTSMCGELSRQHAMGRRTGPSESLATPASSCVHGAGGG